jgi:hypothetical protein
MYAHAPLHLRNYIIHGKGIGTITGSAKFLISYGESLKIACKMSQLEMDDKGRGRCWMEPDKRIYIQEGVRPSKTTQKWGVSTVWMDQVEYWHQLLSWHRSMKQVWGLWHGCRWESAAICM